MFFLYMVNRGFKQYKEFYLLAAIFLAVLGIRLYFALQTDSFSDDISYFVVRQVDNIKNTGLPLFTDELSFGGRTNVFMPVFFYVLTPFYFFFSSPITLKILSNIFASSLVIIVFFISSKLTKDKAAALLTAVAAGFIPIFFNFTVNEIHAASLAIPLIFLTIYYFINIEKEINVYKYLFSVALLSALLPIAIILILAFLFYLLLVRLEGLKQSRKELEIILFSTFLIVWRNFIFYKKALLFHGNSIMWQNLPTNIIADYFSSVSPFMMIIHIGIIPLLIGVYSSYRILFKEKNRTLYLLVSLSAVSAMLLWLKMLSLELGLTLMIIPMILMLPYFINFSYRQLERTKAHKLKKIFLPLLLLIFIITSTIPSIANSSTSVSDVMASEEKAALEWLKYNSEENATILSSLGDGHAINQISERKNVWDSNFLLISDVNTIDKDIERIYKTSYETEAVGLLNKYDINYILINDNVINDYGISDLKYASDIKCFQLIYLSGENGRLKIYKSLCRLI